jgi:ribosomal protein L37E
VAKGRKPCTRCGETSYKKFRTKGSWLCMACSVEHIPCRECGETNHDKFHKATSEVCMVCTAVPETQREANRRAKALWVQVHLLRPWGPLTGSTHYAEG